jgi:hypothetical protein
MQYYAQAQEDRIMIAKYLRDMPLERNNIFACVRSWEETSFRRFSSFALMPAPM